MPSLTFHTTFLLHGLLRNIGAVGGQNEIGGGHSLIQGSGRTVNLGDLLVPGFYDWYIRGNFAPFTVYAGNVADYGRVRHVNNLSDDVVYGVRMDYYGVNTPDANAAYLPNIINDLSNQSATRSSALGGTFSPDRNFGSYTVPYVMVSARVTQFAFPMTFQIAADAGDNNLTGAQDNYRNYSGTVRISGERIRNRVTFDTIYKLRGGDPNTMDYFDPDYGGSLQPDGSGFLVHSFGIYANIWEVPRFAFGLGYGGILRVFEDKLDPVTGETVSKISPLFNGLDLRVSYAVMRNMTATIHTNVSFAQSGKSSEGIISKGVLGQDLSSNTTQDWFALYNAFGFSYRWDNQLAASFQTASRYGLITTEVSPLGGSVYEIKRSQYRLAGGAYALLSYHRNFHMSAGLAFLYVNNSYSNTADGAQNNRNTRNASGGAFGIAIPIRMNIYLSPF